MSPTPELDPSETAEPAADGVDPGIYKVPIEVEPEPDPESTLYTLFHDNSSTKNTAKAWGEIVGKDASGESPPD
jgi:hypothetical protein